MKFQVKYSELFCRFSITNSLKRLWMGGLCQNIQLVLVFLKAPLLDLHFCYYTLMTFLMKLFVILLSMLRVSHTGVAGGGREGVSYDFFNPTHHDWYPQWEAPKTIPSWKVKPLSMKWSKKKNPKKSETVTNTCDCFTHKTTLQKDHRYSTKTWFSHLKHS